MGFSTNKLSGILYMVKDQNAFTCGNTPLAKCKVYNHPSILSFNSTLVRLVGLG